MGWMITRATCPCGAVSEAGEDTYLWKYQHKTPKGVWCNWYVSMSETRYVKEGK